MTSVENTLKILHGNVLVDGRFEAYAVPVENRHKSFLTFYPDDEAAKVTRRGATILKQPCRKARSTRYIFYIWA